MKRKFRIQNSDEAFFIWIPIYANKEMHIYRRILPPFLIRFKLFTVDCILSFLDASADINPYFPYTKTIMNWRNTLLHPDQEPMDEASLQLKQELHEELNSLISAFNRCAGQRILNPIHIDNFIVSIFKQNYYFLNLPTTFVPTDF